MFCVNQKFAYYCEEIIFQIFLTTLSQNNFWVTEIFFLHLRNTNSCLGATNQPHRLHILKSAIPAALPTHSCFFIQQQAAYASGSVGWDIGKKLKLSCASGAKSQTLSRQAASQPLTATARWGTTDDCRRKDLSFKERTQLPSRSQFAGIALGFLARKCTETARPLRAEV